MEDPAVESKEEYRMSHMGARTSYTGDHVSSTTDFQYCYLSFVLEELRVIGFYRSGVSYQIQQIWHFSFLPVYENVMASPELQMP